jgi:mRNA-degrading endonuclease RelE of RelBE toxin-antitoxin system
MKWGLVITSGAKRQLRKLTKPEWTKIGGVFSEMCFNPYQGDIRFLKGSNWGLRRRVGEWRILFDLEPEHKVIVITAVKRRGSNTY